MHAVACRGGFGTTVDSDRSRPDPPSEEHPLAADSKGGREPAGAEQPSEALAEGIDDGVCLDRLHRLEYHFRDVQLCGRPSRTLFATRDPHIHPPNSASVSGFSIFAYSVRTARRR